MVYSFHKYWGKTSIDTIQYLLDIREQYSTPLWLGEAGENSNPWFYEVIQLLMEKNGIGWSFWPYKKVETITSPLSAPFSKGYPEILAYLNDPGHTTTPKPPKKSVKKALFGMAKNLAIDKCTFHPDIISALLTIGASSLRASKIR